MEKTNITFTVEESAAELYGNLETAIAEMNALLKNPETKAVTRNDKESEVFETLKALNTRTMEEAFNEWASKPNPMMTALCNGYVKAYSVKKAIDSQSKAMTYLINESERVVDLVKFEDQYAGKGTLSVNGQWRWKAEAFGKNLAKRIASDIKANGIGNDYAMSDKAKGVKFSNTSLLDQLNEIVNDLIFIDNGNGENEFKALSHDVKFALYSVPKRNRKARLSVTVASTKQVREVITEIVHRVVTGAKYDMDYKRIQKKTSLKVMKSDKVEMETKEVKTA